ncbi:Uncharacterized membrane protein [Natronorubrum sediminis]|uniref:Uncharacterized membrane protein n=1 Tax=Natronorubrum sediminis TaxID=640943 RepID=A0A1H6FRI5_9EURY|nr:Uncharacterized membrane protein [Natronorubrum sediminis]
MIAETSSSVRTGSPTEAVSSAQTVSIAGSTPLESVVPSALSLDPLVVGVILAMTIVTVIAKVGGIWFIRKIEVSERLEAGLTVLPGAVVIAVLGPELAAGGPAEWGAAGVVLVVMWKTESILLALCAGVLGVVAFRAVL